MCTQRDTYNKFPKWVMLSSLLHQWITEVTGSVSTLIKCTTALFSSPVYSTIATQKSKRLRLKLVLSAVTSLIDFLEFGSHLKEWLEEKGSARTTRS